MLDATVIKPFAGPTLSRNKTNGGWSLLVMSRIQLSQSKGEDAVKYHRTWLEARIVASRTTRGIDDEKSCRQIAQEQGIVLDEDAISWETKQRLAASASRTIEP